MAEAADTEAAATACCIKVVRCKLPAAAAAALFSSPAEALRSFLRHLARLFLNHTYSRASDEIQPDSVWLVAIEEQTSRRETASDNSP